MSIKALVTVLVLGSSSIALAAPTADQAAYQVVEHRTLPPLGVGFLRHVVEKPAPMVLANDTHLSGRQLIKVATLRPFTKLELRASDGRTMIDRVLINFGNGRTRIVKLGGVVSGKKTFTIDLPGDSRSIKSIVVVGSSKRRASIDVFAS
jgi:hypothetical protein